ECSLEMSKIILCISHCCLWPALSPDLNPIENLWDQVSRHVESRNLAPQNLNDLRASLQEECNAMPQQTISRLVYSMRRRCQAVVDAQRHMTIVYISIFSFKARLHI
uniref:Tc1-like transposase DDE domain-containing protein n=1 Tax=Cyprinus carpio TaxID=7962 RepID=A0A8C1LFQ3_CYPCA